MTSSAGDGSLVTLVALRALERPNGKLVLTRKFIEGVCLYVRHWQGPVTAVLQPGDGHGDQLDYVEVSRDELPFRIEIVRFDTPAFVQKLRGHDVVFGGPTYPRVQLSRTCRNLGIPCVYITEYTLRTRLQIIKSGTNGLPHFRQMAWELREEWMVRSEIKQASGLQCNGTPTFHKYHSLTPHPFLFFDNRIQPEDLATESHLSRRAMAINRKKPLRLAFSGRLIPMKGADHLIPLARALRERKVPFEMSIFGTGSLELTMAREIQTFALSDRVFLKGNVDFHSELLPALREKVDLFVCCHRQGDPSCTYLETLACGVPIAGYLNEAFEGILGLADIGWGTPVGDIRALANRIVELDRDRDEIIKKAANALAFAGLHSFDATFHRRIDHLRVVRDAHREKTCAQS